MIGSGLAVAACWQKGMRVALFPALPFIYSSLHVAPG